MASQKNQKQSPRRRYSAEFKTEALGLAEQVGVAGAAKQLGLHESQLYAWRKKARYEASRSETEKELAIENASVNHPFLMPLNYRDIPFIDPHPRLSRYAMYLVNTAMASPHVLKT